MADVDGKSPDGSEVGGSGTSEPPLAEARLGILFWIHPSIQVPRSVENSGVHQELSRPIDRRLLTGRRHLSLGGELGLEARSRRSAQCPISSVWEAEALSYHPPRMQGLGWQ